MLGAVEVPESTSNFKDDVNDSSEIIDVDGVETMLHILFEKTGSSRLRMKSSMEL